MHSIDLLRCCTQSLHSIAHFKYMHKCIRTYTHTCHTRQCHSLHSPPTVYACSQASAEVSPGPGQPFCNTPTLEGNVLQVYLYSRCNMMTAFSAISYYRDRQLSQLRFTSYFKLVATFSSHWFSYKSAWTTCLTHNLVEAHCYGMLNRCPTPIHTYVHTYIRLANLSLSPAAGQPGQSNF